MQQPEQMSVPVEAVAQAVTEQRNAAMDQAAQWQAAALQLKAERDQALADLEKLRADTAIS